MEISKRYKTKANQNMVCKLLKTLYGLKQSSQLWYKRFSTFFLEKLGLSQMNIDYNIFVIKTDLNGRVVSMFVNDIKIMTPKKSGIIQYMKAELTAIFSIIDMGLISFCLDLKVEQNQTNQIIKLL